MTISSRKLETDERAPSIFLAYQSPLLENITSDHGKFSIDVSHRCRVEVVIVRVAKVRVGKGISVNSV
jgi:hypothetical protein